MSSQPARTRGNRRRTAQNSTAQRATTGTRRARWQASAPRCTCGRATQQPACVCIEWRQQWSAALAATDLRTFAHTHAPARARTHARLYRPTRLTTDTAMPTAHTRFAHAHECARTRTDPRHSRAWALGSLARPLTDNPTRARPPARNKHALSVSTHACSCARCPMRSPAPPRTHARTYAQRPLAPPSIHPSVRPAR